ncbi:MAG: SWIM zinc finger domain-containing protein [Chlorobiaceae bacterium]|nr:SWIM zinc finger domain-containing protein [Chlorobiaceae bacterium]
MKSIETTLDGIDKAELVDWVGSTIYSRGKSYVDSVSELSCTEDGRLVAWVSGGSEYVTTVRRDGKGEFDYTCSCPCDHGGACKHVVAVLLAAAEALKKKKGIPLLDPESDLYWEASEYLDEEDEEDEDDQEVEAPDVKRNSGTLSAGKIEGVPKEVRSILEKKSREELLEMLEGLVSEYPSMVQWLLERELLAKGKIDPMVRSLRKEIRNLTAMDAWSNEWNDECSLPDYSGVEQRMRALLDAGHADAVFELGQELWQRGNEQVGRSNDDGETAMSIGGCMKIVLKALSESRLSRRDQLVWLFDHLREDAHDLLDGVEKVIEDTRYSTADWHDLSVDLEERLKQIPVSEKDEWRRQHRRTKFVAQLKEAYERAKESVKVRPLLEREAGPCRDYEPLVEYLIEAGDFERARFWCIEGYGKTNEDAPGIANALKRRLLDLAAKEKKYDLVAAYRALDFFQNPSAATFTALRDAAEKIAQWPVVREAAIGFLHNGKVPAASGESCGTWFLPETEVGQLKNPGQKSSRVFPELTVLTEIAILEKRHDDVVALFKELCQTGKCGRGISEKVAEAVRTSYPDTSLKIWRITVDNLIAEVKPHAYQEAAGYLRKMHKVWHETNRLAEWNALIAELRTRHKPKRRLMEVLNDVEREKLLPD